MHCVIDKDENKVSFVKRVCWDIEKRGAVGETPLHICLLVATRLHLDLARRLVKLFPKLVNDICLGDEYYGLDDKNIIILIKHKNICLLKVTLLYILQLLIKMLAWLDFSLKTMQICTKGVLVNFFVPMTKKIVEEIRLLKNIPYCVLKPIIQGFLITANTRFHLLLQ